MSTGDELHHHLRDLEMRRAATVARLRRVMVFLAVVCVVVGTMTRARWMPADKIFPSTPSPTPAEFPTPAPPVADTPEPSPMQSPAPSTSPSPIPAGSSAREPALSSEPILNGNQIVALFGITVVGLMVYGAFSFGRVITISFEISNTRKLLRINAGNVVGTRPKTRDP